jgi:hemolysin III
MDHCTIYLLIAGTYTPICLIALEGSIYCTIILLIEWGSATLGVLLKVIDMNNKIIKVISTLLYVIMGWGIIMFPEAIKMMSAYQFIMILSGGIAYTVGIYFFVTGKNNKWYHSIFHIFCCIGTIVQMVGIIDIFLA